MTKYVIRSNKTGEYVRIVRIDTLLTKAEWVAKVEDATRFDYMTTASLAMIDHGISYAKVQLISEPDDETAPSA